jgi:hypothetical protein
VKKATSAFIVVCAFFAFAATAVPASAATITVDQQCIESATPEPGGGAVSGSFSGVQTDGYDPLSFVSAEDGAPQASNTWVHYGSQSVLVDGQGNGTFSFHLGADYGSQLPDTLWVTVRLTNGVWTPFATVEVPVCGRGGSGEEVPPATSYTFDGFYAPVNNKDASGNFVLNAVKAGSAIPVKFSLGGDYGLDVFEAGYPRSQVVECSSQAEVDGVEQTVNAGASSLSYAAGSDTYNYVWKTDKSWADSCRQLVVKFNDGTTARANFTFH